VLLIKLFLQKLEGDVLAKTKQCPLARLLAIFMIPNADK